MYYLIKLFLKTLSVILSAAFLGSDVDWVLAGSGSLSSGSARSRSQLIAAQRLDPQGTIARVKKGNPWTERKEIVATGLGVRVHSSRERQMVPIDTEKPLVSAVPPSLYQLSN
jgi:hypothetical protein